MPILSFKCLLDKTRPLSSVLLSIFTSNDCKSIFKYLLITDIISSLMLFIVSSVIREVFCLSIASKTCILLLAILPDFCLFNSPESKLRILLTSKHFSYSGNQTFGIKFNIWYILPANPSRNVSVRLTNKCFVVHCGGLSFI